MLTIKNLLRNESGNAMAVAMGVLAVTGVITASVFAVSVNLSSSSNKSRDGKKALAAADAGLEAAVYRMNKQNLENTTSCFTTGLVAPVNGVCPGYTESLGNGSSYTYYVSPALADGDSCAGVPVSYTGDDDVTIVQRCVTAAGTSNGVTRRIQARVASYIGLQLFTIGILGLDTVKINNGSTAATVVGSNGNVTIGNSNSVTGLQLGPSAPNATVGPTSVVGSTERRSVSEGSHVLAPVDVGNSATVNDNARITDGRDASANVTYNAATRVLTMGNNSSLTLGGGTYNFCKFEATNSATLNVAVGAKTRIFIDSPDRAGSGCAAGTGTFTAKQALTINNPGAAENLQIYVYGRSSSGADSLDVVFDNTFSLNKGFIYAPQSAVEFKNAAIVVGAVASTSIDFKNTVHFTWDATLADLRAETLSVFYKTAWKECRSQQLTSTDPTSGCTTQ